MAERQVSFKIKVNPKNDNSETYDIEKIVADEEILDSQFEKEGIKEVDYEDLLLQIEEKIIEDKKGENYEPAVKPNESDEKSHAEVKYKTWITVGTAGRQPIECLLGLSFKNKPASKELILKSIIKLRKSR